MKLAHQIWGEYQEELIDLEGPLKDFDSSKFDLVWRGIFSLFNAFLNYSLLRCGMIPVKAIDEAINLKENPDKFAKLLEKMPKDKQWWIDNINSFCPPIDENDSGSRFSPILPFDGSFYVGEKGILSLNIVYNPTRLEDEIMEDQKILDFFDADVRPKLQKHLADKSSKLYALELIDKKLKELSSSANEGLPLSGKEEGRIDELKESGSLAMYISLLFTVAKYQASTLGSFVVVRPTYMVDLLRAISEDEGSVYDYIVGKSAHEKLIVDELSKPPLGPVFGLPDIVSFEEFYIRKLKSLLPHADSVIEDWEKIRTHYVKGLQNSLDNVKGTDDNVNYAYINRARQKLLEAGGELLDKHPDAAVVLATKALELFLKGLLGIRINDIITLGEIINANEKWEKKMHGTLIREYRDELRYINEKRSFAAHEKGRMITKNQAENVLAMIGEIFNDDSVK